ncbi:hypothetical protein TGAM01_v202583, partial [Trichoderma gamsii]
AGFKLCPSTNGPLRSLLHIWRRKVSAVGAIQILWISRMTKGQRSVLPTKTTPHSQF